MEPPQHVSDLDPIFLRFRFFISVWFGCNWLFIRALCSVPLTLIIQCDLVHVVPYNQPMNNLSVLS
jgi:hypothetical protein